MKVKVVVKQQGTQGFAICEPECHIPNTQNGYGFKLNISQFKQRHMVLEIRVKLPDTASYERSEWTMPSGPVYSAF